MRKFIVTGRLGADAEVRQSASGMTYVTFRMANSEYFDKNPDGSPKTMWIRVTMFNNISLVNHLKKGKAVSVIGNYKHDLYKNNNTGNCEISNDLTADSVEFLSLGEGQQQNKSAKVEESVPQIQTTMIAEEKPVVAMTTEEVKATLPNNDIDEDDLPF